MPLKTFLTSCGVGAIALLSLAAGFLAGSSAERWPVHVVSPDAREKGATVAAKYVHDKTATHLRAQYYGSDGDYLNYGKYVSHSESERLRKDDLGLPLLLVSVDITGTKEWQYVPGTLANFALAAHGRFLREHAPLKTFLDAASKLKELVGPDGALRNNYRFRHYSQPAEYPLGWISGMDQGLALSVFYRAYKLTGDESYVEAGNRVLDFLQVPFPGGPMNTLSDLDPTLNGYIWIDEYLATPNVYTLNGYMFALLGLYDWSRVSTVARGLFEQGVASLEKMLPYFDVGSFSTYDLSYITNPQPDGPHFGQGYHGLHIAQLKALYSVTGAEIFDSTARRWLSYVAD